MIIVKKRCKCKLTRIRRELTNTGLSTTYKMKTIKVISIDMNTIKWHACVNALINKEVSRIRIKARYTYFWR